MEKILLKDDNAGAENAINAINQGYQDGLNLLQKLSVLGLEVKEVKDWQKDVEPYFKQQFPNSTLDFNLEASGLKKQYYEAEQLFKTSHDILFAKPTADELEAVREHYKTYTQTEKQVEAYNLIHDTVKNLNSIKELGLPVSVMSVSELCPLMVNSRGVVEVYTPNLISFIQGLK